VTAKALLTADDQPDTPTYRMKLATAIEKSQSPLRSMETGKIYYRLLLSPEAVQAIMAARRGV
jgi:hypothetical protein